MAPGMSWGEDVNLLSLCLMYGKTHYKDTIKVPKQTYFLFCSKYKKISEEKERGVSYQLFFEMLCTRGEKLSTYDDTKFLLLHFHTSVPDCIVTQQLLKKVVTNHNLIWKVWALHVASYNSSLKLPTNT